MKLHASGEDYLEAILILQNKQGMVDVYKRQEINIPKGLFYATG